MDIITIPFLTMLYCTFVVICLVLKAAQYFSNLVFVGTTHVATGEEDDIVYYGSLVLI